MKKSTFKNNKGFFIVLTIALGGFLMGFDASVISGAIGFVEQAFQLSRLKIGWLVASLTLSASISMLIAGPLSQRIGRIPVLRLAAFLFIVSALVSAFAPSYTALVIARMIGGIGVGAALIVAPMYIAEISPPEQRGKLVSINQLNIVLGISIAFFCNYLLLKFSQLQLDWMTNIGFNQHLWRWMLGIEAVPAIFYLIGLCFVPESPRWLKLMNRPQEAYLSVFQSFGEKAARAFESNFVDVKASVASHWQDLFSNKIRLALFIALTVAIVQQITGINAIFFYAPMIFERSGIGTDASLMQATLVGIVNLIFTLLAIKFIDSLGRRRLLLVGLAGIAFFMFLLAIGFEQSTYQLTAKDLNNLTAHFDTSQLMPMTNKVYESDLAFRQALNGVLIDDGTAFIDEILNVAIEVNSALILTGILGFVACFAFSLGPVMWVLLSELFPNRVRAIGVSVVGMINSMVSFLVQLIFPLELNLFGNAITFFIFGVFALIGLLVLARWLPETKGLTLEQVERVLSSKLKTRELG